MDQFQSSCPWYFRFDHQLFNDQPSRGCCGGLLNINEATAEELMTLPGIGRSASFQLDCSRVSLGTDDDWGYPYDSGNLHLLLQREPKIIDRWKQRGIMVQKPHTAADNLWYFLLTTWSFQTLKLWQIQCWYCKPMYDINMTHMYTSNPIFSTSMSLKWVDEHPLISRFWSIYGTLE